MVSSTQGDPSCQSKSLMSSPLFPIYLPNFSKNEPFTDVVLCRPKDCYYDAEGGTDHTLKIPYDKCGLTEDSEGFLSQVLVVQHDDWLIFPGDLAFTLQCRQNQVARIGLSDPDPSSAGKELPKHKKSTVESQSGSVTFTPEDVRPRKKKKKTGKTEL